MLKFSVPDVAPLSPPQRLLMGPGPSAVAPSVYAALSKPMVGHLDPYFLKIMDETQAMLRFVFQTTNALTIPVSGTGSAGMETTVLNMIEPGERMLVCAAGVFGYRMADMASRAGAEVYLVEKPWGEIFSLGEIADAIAKFKPKVLGIVHAETSTGAWQPLEGIGDLMRERDGYLLADCVTSLCGIPVLVDEWKIDAVFSGTQKCLSAPPGLAPVSFSARAQDKMKQRKTKLPSWYFDVGMVSAYWGKERSYHHTAPISMVYALHEALRLVAVEGLEQRWQRHQHHHESLKKELVALGLSYLNSTGTGLPQLNAINIPDGVDDVSVRQKLLSDHNIEIGGGLGPLKGKVWRIGLMGHAANSQSVRDLVTAFGTILKNT